MTVATIVSTRRQQAEQRLLVIKNALTVADEELAKAYAAKDWEAFGLASWSDYCTEMLPELKHIKLRAPARRERAAKLLPLGASRRDLAAASGCDVATAHRDALVLEGRAVANATPAPAQIPPTAPPVQLPKTDRVVALVAAQGARGLTCLELEHETGWRHGVASGPVSTVARQGRIRATGRFREGYGVYVSA